MEEEEFSALKKFEDEIAIYIDKVRETEKYIVRDNERFLRIQDEKMQFERKLYNLVSYDEQIVSIKSILPRDNRGIVYLTSIERSAVEKFCKYGRERDESYSCVNNYLLIKNKLLREIYGDITKNNFYKDLKSELKKNKIPLDCLFGVEVWIRNYEDSLFSEKFHIWTKMVNQYPTYQTYMSSFLFENPVFNKIFCNRLFSYFI